MNKIIALLTLLILVSCGQGTTTVNDGTSCSVEEIPNGAKIVCTDGTEVVVENGNGGEGGSTSLLNIYNSDDLTSCNSKKGLVIESGLDLNDNEILDSSEVTNTAIICREDRGNDGKGNDK